MINPNYPDVRDRDTFTVMQACRILGICRTSLRKYDDKNVIRSQVRRDGRKVYTGRAIKDFYTSVKNF